MKGNTESSSRIPQKKLSPQSVLVLFPKEFSLTKVNNKHNPPGDIGVAREFYEIKKSAADLLLLPCTITV